jgi:hypothetical protein
VTRHKWKLVLVHLDIALILTQDGYVIYAERTIGWTHQMELLGDVGHVKYRFGIFGDSVSVSAR